MALPKLPVTFSWGAVKTSTQSRVISAGELTELVNYRRTVDGELRKRLGYDKTAVSTFHGGTYLGPPSEVQNDDHVIVRDSVGAVFSVEGTSGYYRGTDRRATPRWYQTGNLLSRSNKALSVMVGSDQWNFSLGTASGGSSQFQLTVIDPLTHEVKRETEAIDADDFDVVSYAAVVDLSGVVWVFYFGYGTPTVIRSLKFATVTSAPVDVLYDTHSEAFTSVDARVMANGDVVVAGSTFSSGGGFHYAGHRVSKLNSGTGAASGAVTYLPSGVVDTRSPVVGGCSLFGDGANGSLYLTYWVPDSSADDSGTLLLHTLNSTTLARTTVSLGSETMTGAISVSLSVAAGYLSDNGDRVVYGTLIGDPSGGNLFNTVVNRYTYDGSITTKVFISNWSYVAGRPFKKGDDWFFVTGFDDTIRQRVQRGYFLRNSDGDIISTLLDGEGTAILHAGGLSPPPFYSVPGDAADPYVYHAYSSHMVNLEAIGDDVFGAFMTEGLTSRDPAPATVRFSFDEVYFSDLPGAMTGGVPKYVSTTDHLSEGSPILFPHISAFISLNGDTLTPHSTNAVQFLYATHRSDGKVVRSAPRALETFEFTEFSTPSSRYVLSVPTCSHVIGQVWIELYGSPNGGVEPFLQASLPNDPTAEYVEFQIYPLEWDDAGESIYSFGAALENESPPACRLATLWRDRPWYAGTPDGQIWPGMEALAGNGYRFNSALSFPWTEGTGEVTAMCQVSWDALALFKEDAIGLVTGPGPDGLGQGGYQVQTISAKKGISMATPGARGQGPAGLYFQNKADGRMQLLAGGTVAEISQGQESYADRVVTSVVHDASAREMLFYCTSGEILALDYAHPTAEQPAGQWYLRTSDALLETSGARLVSGRVVHVDTEAPDSATIVTWTPGVGFDDDGTEILTTLTTGDMSPPGVQNEFDVDMVQFSSTKLAGASTYRYTLTSAKGAAEPHADVDSDTADVEFRSALYRTRTVRVKIEETSATGEGRKFDSVSMTLRPYGGRLMNPYRRIS